MSITSDTIRQNGFIHALCDDAADDIEQLERDYIALLACREREAERLDWLLARIRGDELRRLVGEMNNTRDSGEWREKLDKAMGNAELTR